MAAFWAEVLGYRMQDPPPGFDSWQQALIAMNIPEDRHNDAHAVVDPAGAGPRVFFQKVPEGNPEHSHRFVGDCIRLTTDHHARRPGSPRGRRSRSPRHDLRVAATNGAN